MGKLKKTFIWKICLDINYIQEQFLVHKGYFKGNKQFPQNVLLFASSNMATLPTHKCLTYSAQNKHYSYGLPVQLENCIPTNNTSWLILAQDFRNGKMYYII
jgi:hypothetical protein